ARHVRVRVAVGGAAVGGPAGVADTGGAREPGLSTVGGECLLEVGELARPLLDPGPAGTVEDGDSRGVVTAVFHPPQGLDDDWKSSLLAHITDDSAHGRQV